MFSNVGVEALLVKTTNDPDSYSYTLGSSRFAKLTAFGVIDSGVHIDSFSLSYW